MQGGALSSANEEARITHSKDKGLRPMMSWFEGCINLDILPAIDKDREFEFAFVGFDAKTDAEKAELSSKQAATYKSVNEIRQEQGMEERPDCDVILNTVWLQNKQAVEAAQQEEAGDVPVEGGEPPGVEGADKKPWHGWTGGPGADGGEW